MVLLPITFAITLANAIFIYLIFREIQMIVRDFDRKLMELHIDTELTEAFDGKDINDINKLATSLSERIKRQFRLSAGSFSELVSQLRSIHTDKHLKETLIDFFERIVVISYKDEDLAEDDKSDLKAEYKVIIKMLDKAQK